MPRKRYNTFWNPKSWHIFHLKTNVGILKDAFFRNKECNFQISTSFPVPRFTTLTYNVPTSRHRKWKHIVPWHWCHEKKERKLWEPRILVRLISCYTIRFGFSITYVRKSLLFYFFCRYWSIIKHFSEQIIVVRII